MLAISIKKIFVIEYDSFTRILCFWMQIKITSLTHFTGISIIDLVIKKLFSCCDIIINAVHQVCDYYKTVVQTERYFTSARSSRSFWWWSSVGQKNNRFTAHHSIVSCYKDSQKYSKEFTKMLRSPNTPSTGEEELPIRVLKRSTVCNGLYSPSRCLRLHLAITWQLDTIELCSNCVRFYYLSNYFL